MGKFLERHKLLKLTQEETKYEYSINRLAASKEMELLIKILKTYPRRKSQVQTASLLISTFKEEFKEELRKN